MKHKGFGSVLTHSYDVQPTHLETVQLIYSECVLLIGSVRRLLHLQGAPEKGDCFFLFLNII